MAIYLMHVLAGSGVRVLLQKVLHIENLCAHLALLFLSAHLSTFYYEQKWISLGKRLSSKLRVGGSLELK